MRRFDKLVSAQSYKSRFQLAEVIVEKATFHGLKAAIFADASAASCTVAAQKRMYDI